MRYRLLEAWRVLTGKTPPHPNHVPRIILNPGDAGVLILTTSGWLLVEVEE